MTAYTDLLSLPSAAFYLAVETSAIVRSTGGVRAINITDAPRLFTAPGDTPANTGFYSVIRGGLTVSRSITDARGFTGKSTYTRGTITVPIDHDLFRDYLDLRFAGQTITIKGGGRLRADGSPYPFADYETIFSGRVFDVTASGSGELEIEVAGTKSLCLAPVVSEVYRGFGVGAELEASRKFNTSSTGSLFTLTSGLSVMFFGKLVALPVGSDGALVRHNADFGLTIATSGTLGLLYDGGIIATSYTVGATDTISAMLSLTLTSGTTFAAEVWAGKDGRDIARVLETSITTSITDGDIHVGRYSGSGMDMEAWEIRIYSVPTDGEAFAAAADSPVSDPTGDATLVEAWKFGEGTGSTVLGSKGAADMTYTGPSINWISTHEGDDPEDHDGALVGKSKPDGFGESFNVPLDLLDTQRKLWGWSGTASVDLLRLKIDGAPLVPDERFSVSDLGDISFDATADAFVLAGDNGHRFIGGQSSPPVDGQLLLVELSGTYDGTWRVAVDGVVGDGTIKVTTTGGGPTGLPDGDLAVGSVLRTPDASIDYYYDLARSTARFVSEPAGKVTADVVRRLGRNVTVSQAAASLLGSVNNSLTFNPVVGVDIPTGGSPSIQDLIDELMRSCFGYWAEESDGWVTLANYELPSGPAAAAFVVDASLIDGALPAIRGRVLSVAAHRAKIPSWQQSVGYARTVETIQSTPESIPQSVRDRLGRKWKTEIRSNRAVLDEWPLSVPESQIDTHLVRRTDALELLRRAALFLGDRHRFLDLEVGGVSPLALPLNSVVWVQHPDPAKGITTPTLARVRMVSGNTASDVVKVGVYL